MIRFNVKIGKVYNNGVLCSNPTVERAGAQGIFLNCIDDVNGVYAVELDDTSEVPSCMTFIIRCSDCHDCPPLVKEYCFCENSDDCQDCHYCGTDGQCISQCTFGQICVNDSCKDCQSDNDCVGNQKCNGNGKCECPVGTTKNDLTGNCDNCSVDNDCPPCFVCDLGTCVPKYCAGGICDPTNLSGQGAGNCVGCLEDGHCGTNEQCGEDFTCECLPGFVRINGVCVQGPECTSNAACKAINPCLSCQTGRCLPIRCKGGETPVNIDGVCSCQKICENCVPGKCPTGQYCSAVSDTVCACVPCKGNCTSGCEDPCYCSPFTTGCVENPCINVSCTNGNDCGPNCGCDKNGQCQPCNKLSCTNGDCATTLGCGCTGNICATLGCNQTDCSDQTDCGPNCTCDGGKCKNCGNYTCSECGSIPGCSCGSSGKCEGTEVACTDTLNIIKYDDSCYMVGKLVSQQSCNCSPLTLDIKGRINSGNDEEYNITFLAEIRKGSYNGVNPDGNPLLDDTANDSIAENEAPTSGVIEMRAIVTWALFEQDPDEPTHYLYVGQSTDAPILATAAFPSSGDEAQVEFPARILPKTNVRVQSSDTTQKEAVSIVITFNQVGAINIPNQCLYSSGASVGFYGIYTPSDYAKFSTTSFTNPIATTITSQSLRYPLFRWYKDGVVVRKAYISGSGVYEDEITGDVYDWLESCSEYVLETDCSCEDSVNKQITFCKPDGITYELTNCNKKFKLTGFSTCPPNYDQEFYIKGGDLNITFKGQYPPLNQVYESDTCISELKFGLSCDNACEITYSSPCPDITVELVTACDPDEPGFRVAVPTQGFDGVGNPYNITSVTINNLLIPAGATSPLIPPGTYTAYINIQGGCDDMEQTLTQYCCFGELTPISRQCDGTVIGEEDDDVDYYLNGLPQDDIIQAVQNLGNNTSAIITAKKLGCPDIEMPLPALNSVCCENYSINLIEVNSTLAILQVLNASGDVTTANITITGGTPTVSDVGDNIFYISNFVVGNAYTILVSDPTCGNVSLKWTPAACNLGLTLTENDDCEMVADITDQGCICTDALFNIEITQVIDEGDDGHRVYWKASLGNADSDVVTGLMSYKENNKAEVALGAITIAEQTGSFLIDTPPTGEWEPQCIPTTLKGKISGESYSGSCSSGDCHDVSLQIFLDGVNIVSDTTVASFSVTLTDVDTGESQTKTSAPSGTFIFNGLASGPIPFAGKQFAVNIQVTKTDGSSYSGGSYNLVFREDVWSNHSLATGICDDSYTPQSYSNITFYLKDLVLEDDCAYDDGSNNFMVWKRENTFVPDGNIQVPMVPTSTSGKTHFLWYKDGAVVFSDYQPSQSVLPSAYYEQGSEYIVVATCAGCSDSAEAQALCLPTPAFNIPGYNESLEILLTGQPGTYLVTVDGTGYNITIDGGGTGSGVHPGPLTPDTTLTVTIEVSGIPGQATYEVPTDPSYVAEFTATACNTATNTYGIVITNAGPGYVTTINSGTGSVAANGYDIVGVSEADPVNFTVTHPEGATSGPWLGLPLASCFVSSSDTPASSSYPTTPAASSSLVPGGSSSQAAASSSALPASSYVGGSSYASSSNVPAVSSSPIPQSSSLPNSSSNIAASSPSLPSSSAITPPASSPGGSGFPSSSAAGAASQCGCTATGQPCGNCGTCVGYGGGYICEQISYGSPCSGEPGTVCTQSPITGCWNCELPA